MIKRPRGVDRNMKKNGQGVQQKTRAQKRQMSKTCAYLRTHVLPEKFPMTQKDIKSDQPSSNHLQTTYSPGF